MVGENTVTDGTHNIKDASVYGSWAFADQEGGLAVFRTDTLDPADTDAALVSPGIPGDMAANRKLRVGFNTTAVGADVTSDFGVQGSYNGKDWTLISELDADVTPDVAGIQEYELDLTDKYYPWIRLIWNDGTEDNTTWQGYFFVSGLKSGGNIASSMTVGGVGPDPS